MLGATTIIQPHLSQGEAAAVDNFQPSHAQSEEVETTSVNVTECNSLQKDAALAHQGVYVCLGGLLM